MEEIKAFADYSVSRHFDDDEFEIEFPLIGRQKGDREWRLIFTYDDGEYYTQSQYGKAGGKIVTSARTKVASFKSGNTKILNEYLKKFRENYTSKKEPVPLNNSDNICYGNTVVMCILWLYPLFSSEAYLRYNRGNLTKFINKIFPKKEEDYQDAVEFLVSLFGSETLEKHSEFIIELNGNLLTYSNRKDEIYCIQLPKLFKLCTNGIIKDLTLNEKSRVINANKFIIFSIDNYSSNGKINATDRNLPLFITIDENEYELSGFIKYVGGHYINYVKSIHSTDKWFYCNSGSVREIDSDDLFPDGFLTHNSGRGNIISIIFYKKIEVKIYKPMLASVFNPNTYVDEEKKYVQPKFDGVRAIVSKQFGNIIIQSRNGRRHSDFIHTRFRDEINSLIEMIQSHYDEEIVIDGELYSHGYTLQQINAVVSKTVNDPSDKVFNSLKFNIFTFFSPDRSIKMSERVKLLGKINGDFEFINIVETMKAFSLEEINGAFTKFFSAGYEGLMVYEADGLYEEDKRSKKLLKYKEFRDIEGKIIDVLEGDGNMKGKAILTLSVDELIDNVGERIKLKKPIKFNVAIAGTHQVREEVFINRNNYIGTTVNFKYTNLSDDNIPKNAVASMDRPN